MIVEKGMKISTYLTFSKLVYLLVVDFLHLKWLRMFTPLPVWDHFLGIFKYYQNVLISFLKKNSHVWHVFKKNLEVYSYLRQYSHLSTLIVF